MASVVDEYAGENLREDGNGLDAEGVCVYGGLGEAGLVVLEPEEKHALECKCFDHGGDDGETGEDIAGVLLVDSPS